MLVQEGRRIWLRGWRKTVLGPPGRVSSSSRSSRGRGCSHRMQFIMQQGSPGGSDWSVPRSSTTRAARPATRAVLRTNAQGQTVAVTEPITTTVEPVNRPLACRPASPTGRRRVLTLSDHYAGAGTAVPALVSTAEDRAEALPVRGQTEECRQDCVRHLPAARRHAVAPIQHLRSQRP